MRRKTFDTLLTAGGVVITIVLVVAGALLLWGHNFANDNVRTQLAQQQIYVPAAGSSALASPKIGPYLNQYAGQEVLSGPAAKAYADHFIAVHLSEMPYNGVYSKVSAAAMAAPKGSAQATQLQAVETTVFQGTTLRGLLLEAYAFWEMGQIALIAAIASFVGAGLMLILSVLGIWHLRKVNPKEEVLAHTLHLDAPQVATV
ncbi:MAG TPA: hypothetical protein VFN68_08120 [Acidimicrobiales bacterium]|nr:hypothetical protein [Acidimicrobiales bacterium]